MEEEEISNNYKLAPSVLEAPNIIWTNYIGVESAQNIKMGKLHPSEKHTVYQFLVQAKKANRWDHGNRQRDRKEAVTDLRLLMTEIQNDPELINTFVCV